MSEEFSIVENTLFVPEEVEFKIIKHNPELWPNSSARDRQGYILFENYYDDFMADEETANHLYELGVRGELKLVVDYGGDVEFWGYRITDDGIERLEAEVTWSVK